MKTQTWMKDSEVVPQSKSRTTKTDRLVHREKAYGHYRRRTIPEKYRLSNAQEFVDICTMIWEVTADELVEREAGVFLDDFGYLCLWTPASNRIYDNFNDKDGLGLYLNQHTGGRLYFPTLITDTLSRLKNHLKCWSLDKTFNASLKKRLSSKLKTGFKYKFHPTLVKSIKNSR